MARGQILDLTGLRFGRLTVLRRHSLLRGRVVWLCLCDCGREHPAASQNLVRGSTKSCGCYRRETSAAKVTTHGQTRSPTFNSWMSMRQRCTNPSDPAWKYYGGRGIKVCARWGSFANFLADMGERPAGKSLDRWPDNDGNYTPGNCRWATATEQRHNQRPRGRC